MVRVVVIGGGISGLASAWRIGEAARAAQEKVEILLLEADPQLGGKIQSDRHGEWIVETGPNGWLDSKPATGKLVEDLGIGDKVIPADNAAKIRFLFVDGRLKQLPTSPPAFMTSSVLPIGGRLRILLEPFCKKGPADETLADFGRRRLGQHAVDRLLDPFVSGIFAGDVEKLSVTAAFPAVKTLELEYGGLIKGMRARAKERRKTGTKAKGTATGPGGHLHSLTGGLVTLIEALGERLDADMRTGTEVQAVTAREGGGFDVRVAGETINADVVVSATPAAATIGYLKDLDASICDALTATPYASVAVVATGFRRDEIGCELGGFGYLIPSLEKRRILGSLWTSSIYPGQRAPADHVLLRTLVGGARHPELAALPDDEMIALVRDELAATMGLRWHEPSHLRIFRWPEAIPQYMVGHTARMAQIEERLTQHPGLFLTGNHLYGVGINDCAGDAERVGVAFGEWLSRKRQAA